MEIFPNEAVTTDTVVQKQREPFAAFSPEETRVVARGREAFEVIFQGGCRSVRVIRRFVVPQLRLPRRVVCGFQAWPLLHNVERSNSNWRLRAGLSPCASVVNIPGVSPL